MSGKQMLQLLALLALLVVGVWLAFYVLVFVLAASAVVAAVVWVRRILIEKGIVVPAANDMAASPSAGGQTIEVEYTEVMVTAPSDEPRKENEQ